MSVTTQINRIKKAVADTYSVAESLGATAPSAKTLANLPSTVESLQSEMATDVTLLRFTNKSVATSAWKALATTDDAAKAGFTLYANISLSGVTSDMISSVIFNAVDATSGNYSPTSATSNGYVTIYALNKPTATVVVPTIACIK